MFTFNNVSFAYPNGNKIIENMSFTVGSQETVGLVGCNGAGKSTLLSLICGINLPTAGEITINDTVIEKKNLAQIRRDVGMVFQNPDEQLFMPNIFEDVAFGPNNFGCSKAQAREKANTALSRMGILHLAECPPYHLSGGEKRSAAIATVLAMEPSLILFDEPSAFLDPRATKKFQSILNNLELTSIVASHDLDLILNTCQRVLILEKGTIVADGDPELILRDEKLLQNVGLELPSSFSRCKKCPYHKPQQQGENSENCSY